MRRFLFVAFCSGLIVVAACVPGITAQDQSSRIFVNVVLVQLNVAVTDRNGNYITGLRPENFVVSEDKIPEKIASFEEGGIEVYRLISARKASRQERRAYERSSKTHR